MPKAKRKFVRQERKPVAPAKVDFVISYKNYDKLARFINDRARISGRKRSGLSAKDQRKITREIKRARILGLLPFKPRV